MALPTISLLLSLLVMATPVAGSSEKIAPTGLIKCYDAAPALTNATNATEFRASMLRLLGALPSAVAPTGFASLNLTGRDSVFVRGLCFGDSPMPPSECLGCLSAAARDLASGCHATTRRAGIWTDGCFVAYADTYYTTPSEDGFRSRVLLRGHVAVPVANADPTHYSDYLHAEVVAWAQHVAEGAAVTISGPRMVATADDTSDDGWTVTVRRTVHVLAQCARDRTELDCSLWLMDSAQAVDWDLDAARGDGGVAAAVVGFNCYLRFEVSSSLVPQEINSTYEKRAHTDAGSFLIKCYDAAPAATNDTEFRASLLRLLRLLPSTAAPTGFASMRSTGRDRAFVRGLCFGDSTVPSECRGCLSVAARNLSSGCGTTTRRAGIWSDSCFIAYADTDYSSFSEYTFRSRVLLRGHVAVPAPNADPTNYSNYRHARVVAWAQFVVEGAALSISGPRMVATADDTSDSGWPVTVRSTVHVLAQCPRDRTELDCSLCLMESAKAVDWDLDAARGDGGVAAAVVGFNCYLRFEVSSSLLSQNVGIFWVFFFIVVGGLTAAVIILGPLACWDILRNRK